jgi:hypothetical protein
MITGLFCLVLGAFVGWMVPRPAWADKIIKKYTK